MKTIHKYQMKKFMDPIMMPEGAEILSIQIQRLTICIWAMVNDEAPIKQRDIYMFGTYQILPKDMSEYKYITTLQVGELIWHFFERCRRENG